MVVTKLTQNEENSLAIWKNVYAVKRYIQSLKTAVRLLWCLGIAFKHQNIMKSLV